jgi:hypothetical protein
MSRAAPYWPISATGDGTTKEFTLGFPFLNQDHLRVFVNGVLQTIITHYTVQDPTSPDKAKVKFVTAPTNGHAIKIYRNTPIAKYRGNPNIGQVDGIQALYLEQERKDTKLRLPYYINGTDLSAGTAASIVAPCDGYIEGLESNVVDAAISTGGAVTVEVDTVAVTGLSITVSNSAAIGVKQQDTPTTAQSATTKVKKGQTITVTPAAAFNGGGALAGHVEIQPADL